MHAVDLLAVHIYIYTTSFIKLDFVLVVITGTCMTLLVKKRPTSIEPGPCFSHMHIYNLAWGLIISLLCKLVSHIFHKFTTLFPPTVLPNHPGCLRRLIKNSTVPIVPFRLFHSPFSITIVCSMLHN